MHSIHFAFALGCFVAPLIAEPFLNNTQSLDINNVTEILNSTVEANATAIVTYENTQANYNISGMVLLYPIVGLFTILTSIGYLIYGIIDIRRSAKIDIKYNETKTQDKTNDIKTNITSAKKRELTKFYRFMVVVLLLGFIFLYVGMEVMYGTFVATFAVQSNLHLTRQEAARVNAIFWGCFAAMRFSAIFIAFKFSPLSQMMFSFTLCIIGSITLAIAGNIFTYVLCICSAIMGTGMASVFACGILWLEQHVTVTNRIGSYWIISQSIGADLFPIILGQFMADFPMLLMYLQVTIVCICIILFAVAHLLTRIKGINQK